MYSLFVFFIIDCFHLFFQITYKNKKSPIYIELRPDRISNLSTLVIVSQALTFYNRKSLLLSFNLHLYFLFYEAIRYEKRHNALQCFAIVCCVIFHSFGCSCFTFLYNIVCDLVDRQSLILVIYRFLKTQQLHNSIHRILQHT